MRRIKEVVVRNWHVIALLAIIIVAFWARSLPARFNELQALDPFYLYRISEEIVYSGYQLPAFDTLRYSPLGTYHHETEFLFPVYIPAILYGFLGLAAFHIPYLSYAIMFPALMGALAVFIMYFLGKELLSRKAGILAAFFLALTPAFVTRTSAGFFEKEPIAGVFLVLTALLFVQALKKQTWRNGIFAGLSLAALSMTWGGVNFVYLIFAAFFLIVYSLKLVFGLLGYLSKRFQPTLHILDRHIGKDMINMYLPMVLLGTLLQLLQPRNTSLMSYSIILLYFTVVIMAVRYIAERFRLVKEEYLPYVVPSFMVISFIGVLVASLFLDFVANILTSVANIATVNKGVLGSTVAENAPGSWAHIVSRTEAGGLFGLPSQLNVLWSLWFFALLGGFVSLYMINKRMSAFLPAALFWLLSVFAIVFDWGAVYAVVLLFLSVVIAFIGEPDKNALIYVFPMLWFFSSVISTLNFIRLVFLVGPAFAVMGGIFLAWFIDKAHLTGKGFFNNRHLNPLSIIVVVFVVVVVAVNTTFGFAFASQLGPSICFPRTDFEGNVVPCLTIHEDSSYEMDPEQPWYQAFEFFSTQTPEDTVILSWWDFGYWFQARGKRASVADGGNLGGKYYVNDKLAQWFTSSPEQWDEWREWLEYHKVTHILMDFTLPGKYGAISRISTDGAQTIGMLQFSNAETVQENNKTIQKFRAGPFSDSQGNPAYQNIWIPMEGNGLSGTPMFLIEQGGVFSQPQFINDVCTPSGLIITGNKTPSVGGCVSLSDLGVYFIPPEAEHTIFTTLMFMDGAGLPVTKVFDNRYIKIYEVIY